MIYQQFIDILTDLWQYEAGLGKSIYRWQSLPASIDLLAATDSSGIVSYQGRKYHIQRLCNPDRTSITSYN